MPEFLFIGAHPDDLEIGTGGTIKKLTSKGYTVNACIIAKESDPDIAFIRENEAKEALYFLGLKKIVFLGLEDGYVTANKNSVSALREVLKENNFKPDVVVTHAQRYADSHTDHKQVRDIVEGCFRSISILGFTVENSTSSNFKPAVFINISEYIGDKRKALGFHKSQIEKGRIHWKKIEQQEKDYGNKIGVSYAEAFDVIHNNPTDIDESQLTVYKKSFRIIQEINDCYFNKFWYQLLKNKELCVIREEPSDIPDGSKRKYDTPNPEHDLGYTLLSDAFTNRWFGLHPLPPISSSSDKTCITYMKEHHVLISGSVFTNKFTLRYFNHIQELRYITNYSFPDYSPFIFDLKGKGKTKLIKPTYEEKKGNVLKKETKIVLREDIGILTIMQNPLNSEFNLIGCMGIHSFGTIACFKMLTENYLLSKLMDTIVLPIPINEVRGYQILLKINPNDYYNVKNIKIINKYNIPI